MADAKGKGKARQEPSTADPENPQLIRITNHGKMTTWVAFALDFLDNHESIPIVLHTLPATTPKSPPPPPAETTATATAPAPSNPPSFAQTASTVPRLISVVEIIKREYLKKLELAHSSALTGLYQYNEIGTLEALGLNAGPEPVQPEDARSEAIVAALQGKNHLKTRQTPFMKITLSRVELPDLASAGTTSCQPPLGRKLSKSAKARAKRREKNEGGGGSGEGMAVDVGVVAV
ncbi:hypothetical protein C8R46DRAFT_1343002 [Mycena filopes]|nr:hypothetical protein C8R46DRAFT_1343002 [Mycena filopes]